MDMWLIPNRVGGSSSCRCHYPFIKADGSLPNMTSNLVFIKTYLYHPQKSWSQGWYSTKYWQWMVHWFHAPGTAMTAFPPSVFFLCLVYADNQGVCWFHAIGSTMTVFLPSVPFLCLVFANNQGVCWFYAIGSTMTVFLPTVPFLCLIFADNQSMCSMKRYYCDNPNGKEKCILLPKKIS